MEKWAKIPGYDYEISSLGRVRNLNTGRIKVNCIEKVWYFTVGLFKNGIGRTHRIHRLIMEAFVPNPESHKYINHKNGIKTDNRIENLEWCTQKHNISEAYKIGLCQSVKGSRHGGSVLNEEQVLTIRELLRYSSGRQIAKQFNLSEGTVSMIKNRITWSHI